MKASIILWIIYSIGLIATVYLSWNKLALHQGIKLGITVLAILIPMIVIYSRSKPLPKPNGKIGEDKAEIFFFYTLWCPYCKKSRPAWDEFKQQWEGKKYNGYELFFTEIDCDRKEGIANQYQVNDYPTIKLLKGHDVIEFDAKPSVASLNEFLSSCLDNTE